MNRGKPLKIALFWHRAAALVLALALGFGFWGMTGDAVSTRAAVADVMPPCHGAGDEGGTHKAIPDCCKVRACPICAALPVPVADRTGGEHGDREGFPPLRADAPSGAMTTPLYRPPRSA
ncbi:MAG: hypothetical protein PHS60_04550 [Zavarzinia sp.]|nr:hypothetical protein [Zavarzinia sp.]